MNLRELILSRYPNDPPSRISDFVECVGLMVDSGELNLCEYSDEEIVAYYEETRLEGF